MEKETKKKKPAGKHDFSGKLLVGRRWCKRCGVMDLRNEASRRAVVAPRPGDDGEE